MYRPKLARCQPGRLAAPAPVQQRPCSAQLHRLGWFTDNAPALDRPPGAGRRDEHAERRTPGRVSCAAPGAGAQPAPLRAETQKSLLRRVLEWVLRFAAVLSKTAPEYLKAKDRDGWWNRSEFPRLPHDDPLDPKIRDQDIKLYLKVVPLATIFFLSSFALTILQSLKDSIVVTNAGAEALPFLASFAVLPASIAFFSYYSKLLSSAPPKLVYYLAIAPFVAFYALFAFVIYPNHAALHFTGFAESVQNWLPSGLMGMARAVEMWTFSVFFCFAELWGSVAIALLLWSLANDICTVDEAKTVYPMMGISANIALVIAGKYIKALTAAVKTASTQAWVQAMVVSVLALAGLMALVKRGLDSMIEHEQLAPAEGQKPKKKKKKSGTLQDSLNAMRKSPKVMNLALLVICYAVAHRLFEFAWKAQLRVVFPSAQAFSGALADVSTYTGIATIGMMIGGRYVFEKFGWGIAAMATPTVMFCTGTAFFGLALMAQTFGTAHAATLLAVGALSGAVTQVFARASKFSLFDPAKEMVYIEMEPEEKKQGKAAVDLMGSQVGKSGAAWVIQGALLAVGSATSALPILMTMYLAIIATWGRSALILQQLMRQTEEAKAAEHAKQAEDGEMIMQVDINGSRNGSAVVIGVNGGGNGNGNGAHVPSPAAGVASGSSGKDVEGVQNGANGNGNGARAPGAEEGMGDQQRMDKAGGVP